MKNKFNGFYNPTENEIVEIWKNATFILDTSCLLNLYRLSEQTRNEFISVLNFIIERVYLPYQVAYEYHNNRISVINKIKNSFKEIKSELKNTIENDLVSKLNKFKRHPSINIDKIISLYSQVLEKSINELNNQETNHPNFSDFDLIMEDITKIYNHKVGENYSIEVLDKLYKEGDIRYKNKVPPGYKDKDKGQEINQGKDDDLRRKYGDLIIWKDVIDYSKKNDKPIIFITDDKKEDWWRIEEGKTIGPRVELIQEFYIETNKRILIYDSSKFLKFAKVQFSNLKITDDAVNEINELKIDDKQENQIHNDKTQIIPLLLGTDLLKYYNNGSIFSNKQILAMNEYLSNLSSITNHLEETFRKPFENIINANKLQEISLINSLKSTMEIQNQIQNPFVTNLPISTLEENIAKNSNT